MKRPNQRIIGIEVGEDSQFKYPENIFNQIIEESFPSPKERDSQKHTRSIQDINQFGLEKKILLPHNNQNIKCTEERILKDIRGKGQIIYKGRSIRITPDVQDVH